MNRIQKHWKENRAGLVLLVLTVLFILFIFSRSTVPSEASAKESGSVVGALSSLWSFFGIDKDSADHIVRKLGHFIEFMGLGVLLTLSACFNGNKKLKGHVFTVLFFCLCIPVCDETIQYFSPGRAPEVRDVLLDFSGAVTGFIVVAFIRKICKMNKKKKKLQNKKSFIEILE